MKPELICLFSLVGCAIPMGTPMEERYPYSEYYGWTIMPQATNSFSRTNAGIMATV